MSLVRVTMKIRTGLSLLLCLALTAAMLAGCGQASQSLQVSQPSQPNYVPLAEAVENSIDPGCLEQAAQWPAFEDMPPSHAMILKPVMYKDVFGSSLIQREFIQMIADTGAFNAVHIGYECEFYYSCETGTIDLNYLENLDRVIEWCIESNLHVIWDFASVPGYAGGGPNGDILDNPEHRRQAVELMELFSERYAGVPSGVLSFYILGESGINYFSEEELVELTTELTEGLRRSSPDRGVRSNLWCDDFAGAFFNSPCDGLRDTDTTVGFELYTGAVQTLMGFPDNLAANGRMYANGEQTSLLGDFPAGTELSFLLKVADGVGLGLELVLWADGEEIARLDCDSLDESSPYFIRREGEYYVQLAGYPFTVSLEKDAKELKLGCLCEDESTMIELDNISVSFPSRQARTNMEFYNLPGEVTTCWRYVTDERQVINIPCSAAWTGQALPLSAISLDDDGSFQIERGNEYVQTPESIRSYVEGWAAWGEETGTTMWVSEFGYPMSMPTEDRTAYIRCCMEILEEYGMGWTMFTDFQNNWGPIVHETAFEERISQPSDSGYELHGEFYWDEPVLEILREYLPE